MKAQLFIFDEYWSGIYPGQKAKMPVSNLIRPYTPKTYRQTPVTRNTAIRIKTNPWNIRSSLSIPPTLHFTGLTP
jgi:hypothetical protein